jgi:hypothetical protein
MNLVPSSSGDTIIFGSSSNNEINFSPTIPTLTELANLELWLDANEGALNIAGNNFTDETATIELAGFPVTTDFSPGNPNGPIGRNGSLNGKPFYSGGGEVSWDFDALSGTYKWHLRYNGFSSEGEPGAPYVYLATGNTDYPWQATWSDGTLTRTATTIDAPATNDQTVLQWNNLVSGKPNLSQNSASLQPIFKSNVNGRKAVQFNISVMYNLGLFSSFTSEYSYYLVADGFFETNNTSNNGTIIRIGSSANRGLFQSRVLEGFLAANNGVQRISEISSLGDAVYSARFNVSNNGEAIVGNGKTHETLAGSVGVTASSLTSILLGATSPIGGGSVNAGISEILVYRAFHDEATANQIIDYLAAKWNITV